MYSQSFGQQMPSSVSSLPGYGQSPVAPFQPYVPPAPAAAAPPPAPGVSQSMIQPPASPTPGGFGDMGTWLGGTGHGAPGISPWTSGQFNGQGPWGGQNGGMGGPSGDGGWGGQHGGWGSGAGMLPGNTSMAPQPAAATGPSNVSMPFQQPAQQFQMPQQQYAQPGQPWWQQQQQPAQQPANQGWQQQQSVPQMNQMPQTQPFWTPPAPTSVPPAQSTPQQGALSTAAAAAPQNYFGQGPNYPNNNNPTSPGFAHGGLACRFGGQV